MKYRIFEPNKNLADIVKCFWTLDGAIEDFPEKQTIVPDGCMEMIFHYGDRYRQYVDESRTILQPRCFVVGQLTKPLVIAPTGTSGIFAVRFHPNGFSPFATIPLKKMENKVIPLKKIFGDPGVSIEAQILKTSTTKERIRLAQTFLLAQLTGQEAIDRMVKATVDTILRAYGQLSVKELSLQIKTNRRQLERKFSAAIGLSPKQLSKTIRLQSTLQLLLNNKFTSLTALSYENEFYDQAHFIKDFKEFTGVTPKEFYKDNLKMSALFYGTR